MAIPIRRLLIAEDNVDLLGTWRRDIDEFNNNPERRFTLKTVEATTTDQAVEYLNERQIDCAVIDLRLPESDGKPDTAEHGNRLRSMIEDEFPIPVAIHTGHPGEIDEDGRASPMKIFTKNAGETVKALEWLAEKAALMEALSTTNRRIRSQTARVLYRSILPRWLLTTEKNTPEKFEDIVTRQVVSYIAEHLSLPAEGTPAHHLHEFYYMPPMRERLHTGDMILWDEVTYVVVTPQCDMVNAYPANFLLAKCLSEHDEWARIERAVTQNKGEIKKPNTEALEKLTQQSRNLRLHFLPPCDDKLGPWFVDFGNIMTLKNELADELIQARFASIAAPFVPNLVHRFASFVGRIGQPELDVEALAAYLSQAVQQKLAGS